MTAKPEKYQIINSFNQKESKKVFWFVPKSQNIPNYFIWYELSSQNERRNFRHSFLLLRTSAQAYFGSSRVLRMSPTTSGIHSEYLERVPQVILVHFGQNTISVQFNNHSKN